MIAVLFKTYLNVFLFSEPAEGLWKSQPAVKRPIEVFPGRLLDMCNQDAPLTFLAFLPSGRQGRCTWLARGRHGEVFQVVSLVRRTVLKVVPVPADFSKQRVDAIAAAIDCSVKLSMLRHGMRYRTPNFIEVQRIACVFDQFPKWLLGGDGSLGSRDSLAESVHSETAGTNQCFLTRHFIVFELSYAGKPLSHITLRSAVQGRSLVLQASCCVAVAERALGFRLAGAGTDKLLVAFTDAASLEYCLPDRSPLSVDSAGLRAHLAGCLSFLLGPEADSDEDLALHNTTFGSAFSNCSGPGAQRFYGNVMWLGAVLDCVVRKLRAEVPESRARNERATLEELLSWQGRLKRCGSAGEFVATLDL
ncbi:serine/threonine-protein kinase haspin-like [Amblyomma americanum]